MRAYSALAIFGCGLASLALSACEPAETNGYNETHIEAPQNLGEAEGPRPNILLIVADDLGYTDIGVYGGEISTPNLDQLARDGLILTDYHNQAVCSPTRAALLSGMTTHKAGGAMHLYVEQKGTEGYQPGLRSDVVALPKLLDQAGYFSVVAGKWHLGAEPERRPNARGFDRSFILQQGGASHYSDMRGMFVFSQEASYWQDDQKVDALPEDFYSSDFYTDYTIDRLKENEASGDPWFAYLAYTAPHWPLQAPQSYVDKYKGRYDAGYEALRAERVERGKEMGVIPQDAPTYPRLDAVAAWDSLSAEEKMISAREMEVYAAMVEVMDLNIGRLIAYLKDSGQYENTFILFISDNGAEGANRDPGDNGADWTFDWSLENMGQPDSYVVYGPEWAQAGAGVMRYFKSYAAEGGTRGPAIVHAPTLSKQGEISDAFSSVVDFVPTALELAGIDVPVELDGQAVQTFQGRSMLPFVFGEAEAYYPDDFTFGWEIFGHKAIRKGDWKLMQLAARPAERSQPVPMASGAWGLYNMTNDPGELNDLSAEHPEIVEELLAAWEAYKAENGVVESETLELARPY